MVLVISKSLNKLIPMIKHLHSRHNITNIPPVQKYKLILNYQRLHPPPRRAGGRDDGQLHEGNTPAIAQSGVSHDLTWEYLNVTR